MHVAVLHSAYLSGTSSGENRVVEDEVRLLREAGHRVSTWTPSFDRSRGRRAAAFDAVWSRRALHEVWALTEREAVDVLHVHNLFPSLSPSVLRTDIPTVMTLHNFRLACLPATFLRDGRICEDCLGKAPWRGVLHGCYRGSRPQSAVIATSLSLHRTIGTFRRVAVFAAVSRFVKDKLVEAGLDPGRIRVRPNFAWPTERRAGAGDHFLFLGRLSPEKGLDRIVRGWGSQMKLVVAGDGPERARLEALAGPRVELRGSVEPSEATRLLQEARSLLVPSTCYEGSPRVIAEAFAAGVPVVASRNGGLPEHVDDDVSGLLADPGDAEAWAAAIEQLEDDGESVRLGEGAFHAWRERFSPDVALRSLEALYDDAVSTGRRAIEDAVSPARVLER